MELNQKNPHVTTYGNLSEETDTHKKMWYYVKFKISAFQDPIFNLLKMHLHIPHISYIISS